MILIDYNNIGNKGAIGISEALKINHTLQNLNIGKINYNKIQ